MPFDGSQEDHAPHPVDIAVGHRIRARRKAARISQSKLAKHLGVSFQQVQKYERGANRVSGSVLVRIAERLETRVAELVGETDAPESNPRTATLLASPGAYKLLEVYATLGSSTLRTALLNLAQTLSKADNEQPRPRTVG